MCIETEYFLTECEDQHGNDEAHIGGQKAPEEADLLLDICQDPQGDQRPHVDTPIEPVEEHPHRNGSFLSHLRVNIVIILLFLNN